MKTAGVIVLIIVIVLLAGGVGWVIHTRMRAQRLGLPPPPLSSYIPFYRSSAPTYGPPQPAPGGIVGWVNDRIRTFKNRNARTAAGAYEPSGAGGPRPGRRGFGPFDPDEAWDARVGHEADVGGYYEEQELGLAPRHHHADTSYGGSGGSYQMNLATTPGEAPEGFGGDDDDPRGRTRSRSPRGLAPGAAAGSRNPFDDDADPSNLSMRAVSPRPLDTAAVAAAGGKTAPKDHGSGDSPTERRSIFREAV